MRAPQLLAPILAVPPGQSALAVVAGVAPAVLDAAVFLVINDEYFAEVAGSEGYLICFRVICHAVQVYPVRPGQPEHDIAEVAERIDVEFVRRCADVIPHLPFPDSLSGAAFHFTDDIGPDSPDHSLADLDPVRKHGAAKLIRIKPLGNGFVIAVVLPYGKQYVAVGHHFKGMMRHFLSWCIALVLPYFLAGPVKFLQQACRAAEVGGGMRE